MGAPTCCASEGAVARAANLENAWTRFREADQFRALTTGSLPKLLDSHSEVRANAERGLNGQSDKTTALEEEASNLQLLLKESEKQSTTHQNELQAHRRRVRNLTAEQASFHSQLSGLLAQLTEQISASGQLRQDLTDCETRLRDATRASSDCELRLSMLRNYLAENGVFVDIKELISNGSTASTTAASANSRPNWLRRRSKSRISRANVSIRQEMAVLNPRWVTQMLLHALKMWNVRWQKLSPNTNSNATH